MQTQIVPLPSSGSHAYLLRGEKSSILVDTGTQKLGEQTLAACHHMAVKLILLTHAHFDHCQNAAYFAEELNCPVGVGRGDLPLLKGEKRSVKGEGLWGSAFAHASNYSIKNQPIPAVSAPLVLEDGTPLEPYGIAGRVVALPGHTAGSVGVLLDSGEMLVGDAMSGFREPGAAWCYEDKDSMLASLMRIKKLKPKKIFTGHAWRQK